MYEPKKKTYSTLLSLHDEMIREGIKNLEYDGLSIKTKTHVYTMVDNAITVKER